MILFSKNADDREARLRRINACCDDLIARIGGAISQADRIFEDLDAFIDPIRSTEWKSANGSLIVDCRPDRLDNYAEAEHYAALCSAKERLYQCWDALNDRIRAHNQTRAEACIPEALALLGNVEGRLPDRGQMMCIVKDVHNHLVVAGAGTGKTTVVIGRVNYLLRTGKCAPNEILVLSFTNASANEMKERLVAETGCTIDAMTFHKLGLSLISKVKGTSPKIASFDLKGFLRDQLGECMRSPVYLRKLCHYLWYHRVNSKSEYDFDSADEFHNYLVTNPPITLTGERVKSYGELDIAAFLALNNIRYLCEAPYCFNTHRSGSSGEYRPDFYLPDYGIYLEYYTVDRGGALLPAFGVKMSNEDYRKSMEWKRRTHQRGRTPLIECYAYEREEGILLELLEKRLRVESVELRRMKDAELWSRITAKHPNVLEELVESFETLIHHIKSCGLAVDDVRELVRAESGPEMSGSLELLDLLEPLYAAYHRRLAESGELDFCDMIYLAKSYLDAGRYSGCYRYLIVDEYQDISKARFELLKSLRRVRDYDLFCVGDDWQSIYRFSGSDVDYILRFSHYWGASEISKIETTYRFPTSLVKVSSGFVMRNPRQIRKSMKGLPDTEEDTITELSALNDGELTAKMMESLAELPKDSSVFFLGRYTSDLRLIREADGIECRRGSDQGMTKVISNVRPDLRMTFLTIHKSKGLQADYVFLLNNRSGNRGFPSRMSTPPLLDCLLEGQESFPDSEERRLFYVALTRAKKRVYLLTIRGEESDFIRELRAGVRSQR